MEDIDQDKGNRNSDGIERERTRGRVMSNAVNAAHPMLLCPTSLLMV